MVSPPLLEIIPRISVTAVCPKCHSRSVIEGDILFQGLHVLLDTICPKCQIPFFQTLPSGHDEQYPITFSKDGVYTDYDSRAHVWLANPLIKAMITPRCKISLDIQERSLHERKDSAVLLNCLDKCYGHVLGKLWNAQYLIEAYPELFVIVLIPENFEWLVPEGVSEVWLVRAGVGCLDKHITNLHDYVMLKIQGFTKFYLSLAKVYHDTGKIHMESFTRVKRFELQRFAELEPCVTFVLREDRFWHGNAFEEFCSRALISLGVQKHFGKYFVMKQRLLVMKTIRIIRRQNPLVKFVVTGIGNLFKFNTVLDLRVAGPEKMTKATEMSWCDVYARSHLVIGVHGSGMLIPTSLAAGFIEILPEYKIPHMGEDTISYHSGRNATLLSRHVDAFVSPRLLAKHALQVLKFHETAKLIGSTK